MIKTLWCVSICVCVALISLMFVSPLLSLSGFPPLFPPCEALTGAAATARTFTVLVHVSCTPSPTTFPFCCRCCCRPWPRPQGKLNSSRKCSVSVCQFVRSGGRTKRQREQVGEDDQPTLRVLACSALAVLFSVALKTSLSFSFSFRCKQLLLFCGQGKLTSVCELRQVVQLNTHLLLLLLSVLQGKGTSLAGSYVFRLKIQIQRL